MIKNGSFRRIMIASFALIIVIISIYFFPKKNIKTPSKIINKKVFISSIYLMEIKYQLQENIIKKTKAHINLNQTHI